MAEQLRSTGEAPTTGQDQTWAVPSETYPPVPPPPPPQHYHPTATTTQYVGPSTTMAQQPSSVVSHTTAYGTDQSAAGTSAPAPTAASTQSLGTQTAPVYHPTPTERAELHREKARQARKEKQESHAKWKDDSTKFGQRFSAAGTTVLKWFEEKKHEKQADRIEKAEVEKQFKQQKEARRAAAGTASTTSSETSTHP